ncbi:MAG: glutaredoxin domain-containing protein, partial [Methylococcales bacterium]|nr:glutaredoxin domain-containing protein [Methylococcales bacterium]
MMNVFIKSLIFSMFVLAQGSIFNLSVADSQIIQSAESSNIEVFVRSGCPHCEAAEAFLNALQQEQPHLRIVIHNLTQEPSDMARLESLAQQQHIGIARVPAFYLNGQLLIGYSGENTTGKWIRQLLASSATPIPSMQNEAGSCDVQQTLECAAPTVEKTESFELDFFGQKLTLTEIGLPLFTLAMGLLDGFNPCSMWVLILIISLLAPMHNRWRMFAIAGTFVAVEGIAYFLFMSAWLNLFLWIGLSRISEIIIALIALLAGAINLKDFWFFGRGLSWSIPKARKTDIYARMREILNAQNLTGALIGIVMLAVLVQIVEVMCTSGFPALYTRILTLQHLDNVGYYGYLLLYNVAYMFDDCV